MNSATSATAVLNIDPAATAGARNITLTTASEIVTLSSGFTVTNGTPIFLTATPGSGQQGQSSLSVALTGQYTHWTQGTTTAAFGAGVTVASLTVNSATSATAVLNIDPAATLGARNITLTTGSEVVTLTNGFAVANGTPIFLTATPGSGQQGQSSLSVALTGQYTHWTQGTTTATFGAGVTVASLTVNSATSATAVLNIDPAATLGARNITLTTGSEVVTLTNGFAVANGTPVLLSVNPGSGPQGQSSLSVTLTGQSTHWSQGTTVAAFGSGITVNSLTVNSATAAIASISIDPLAAIGARSVTITTGSEIVSLANSFTVSTGPATISLVTPSSGQQGQAVSVTITGTGTHFSQSSTSVSFGAGITPGAITVTSLTSLTVNIAIDPAAVLGARTVVVSTPNETAAATNGFTVNAGTPVLTSATPSSGLQGQTIASLALVGNFTHWVQGVITTATFGANITVNSLTVISATSATASVTIDPLATVGARNITLTTGGEIVTLTSGFTINAVQPQSRRFPPTPASRVKAPL